MRGILVFTGILSLAACGGPGSFSGKVASQGMDVHSAAFGTVSNVSGGSSDPNGLSIQIGMVVLSNSKNVCTEITNRKRSANEAHLVLMLLKGGAGTATLSTGTYNTSDPNNLSMSTLSTGLFTGMSFAEFVVDNAACAGVLTSSQGTATAGSVTLNGTTSGSSGSADGTFNLTMGSQKDAVSGSFSAPVCAGLQTLLTEYSSSLAAGTSNGTATNVGAAFNTAVPCS